MTQEIIGGVPGGGPRENPRSVSSPKAEKFLAVKIVTDRPTDGQTEGVILSARSRIKMAYPPMQFSQNISEKQLSQK